MSSSKAFRDSRKRPLGRSSVGSGSQKRSRGEDSREMPETQPRPFALKSGFDGYLKHGDKLPAPYDRTTEFIMEDAAEVKLQDLYKMAIVSYVQKDEYFARGSFTKSFVQLVIETCATLPSVALHVRDTSVTEQAKSRWAIDFDLFEFWSVRTTTFRLDEGENDDAKALIKAVETADPGYKLNKDGKYLRIVLRRGKRNVDNDWPDYAMFCDERVSWTPSPEMKYSFDDFQPYRPKMAALDKVSQDTLNSLTAAEEIDIFVSEVQGEVERHAYILEHVTRSGKDDKFRPDWWWSLNKLYSAHGDNDEDDPDAPRHFQQFYHEKHVEGGLQYPERQPWLQKSTGDDEKKAAYIPVWGKTKTRFSGPSAYRCAYMPALMWEIEATAVMYKRQFNDQQTYVAAFQMRGDKVLVKIRVRGPDVTTAHGDVQISPTAGTLLKVRPKNNGSGPAAVHSHIQVFVGQVAEKTAPGWDAMMTCDCPENFRSVPANFAKGITVTIEAQYSSMQDDLALMAIQKAADLAERERKSRPNTDEKARLPWKVSGHTGGAHIKQLSKDFYGDWKREREESGMWSNEDAAIVELVTVDLFEELNPEQKQAYLLPLRGAPKGQLGIEGCPGTGKSRVMRNIAIALLAMGYTVGVSAQSNNGVDAVFGKIAEFLSKHADMIPGLNTDRIVRIGASTIDRKIMSSLIAQWAKTGSSAVPAEVDSAITRENLPYTAAYKMAEYVHNNPDDKLSLDWHAWAAADASRVARFETGSTRRPAGHDTRTNVMQSLMDKVVDKPRLFAATAAALASRHDIFVEYVQSKEISITFDVLIFDEASQSTEASFMTAAMTWVMTSAKLVILGGDTKQLPPVIKSNHDNPFASLLQMSSLERMLRSCHDSAIVNLVRNYRSHKDIVRLASKLFYGNKMKAARKSDEEDKILINKKPLSRIVSSLWKVCEPCTQSTQLNVPEIELKPSYNGRIWMLDVPGFSRKAVDSYSSCNENGIHICCIVAKELALQIGVKNVQIITMYSYELELFRKNKTLPEGVAVKTVDSFQGLEDIAIILHCSAAFHNRKNPVGHIENEKRLNVALTRAREIMFIVGNISFWRDRIISEAGRPNVDSTGKRLCGMQSTTPFYRLIQEAKKAKMVVQLPKGLLDSLPDKYVNRGNLKYGPKFLDVSKRPYE